MVNLQHQYQLYTQCKCAEMLCPTSCAQVAIRLTWEKFAAAEMWGGL